MKFDKGADWVWARIQGCCRIISTTIKRCQGIYIYFGGVFDHLGAKEGLHGVRDMRRGLWMWMRLDEVADEGKKLRLFIHDFATFQRNQGKCVHFWVVFGHFGAHGVMDVRHGLSGCE